MKDFNIKKKLMIYIGSILLLACVLFVVFFSYFFNQNSRIQVEESFKNTLKIYEKIFGEEIDFIHTMNTVIVKNEELIENVKKTDDFGIYGKLADLLRDLKLNNYKTAVLLIKAKDRIAVIPGEFNYTVPVELAGNEKGIGKFFKVIENKLFFISQVPSYDKDGSHVFSCFMFVEIGDLFVKNLKNKFEDEIAVVIDNNIITETYDGILINSDKLLTHSYSITDNPLAEIIVAKDISYISENTRKSGLIIIQVFGAIFLLSLFLANYAALNFTRPILNLSGCASEIAGGNLEKPVERECNDEIGELAFSMETMRSRLKENIYNLKIANKNLDRRVHELSVLNKLNNELNYLQDYKQVFRVILKTFIINLNIEKSSVMLFEHDKLVSVETNLKGDFIDTVPVIKIDKGEGAAGKAFLKEKPVVVNHAEKSRIFSRADKYNHIRNILCIPFSVKDSVKGVFNLVNIKHMWQKKDVELATLIINQGLLAIDNARLYELAITDGLTGLYIHRYFQIRLNEEIMKSQRFSKKLCLAMIDIDYFKKFNDTYGHQAGDKVLKIVSGLIDDNIRKGVDIAARYGGEEFAVIMPDTDITGALKFAERLREKIQKEELFYNNQKLSVTISCGLSCFPVHALDSMKLVMTADNALYESKENGRNRVTVADETVMKRG